MDFDQLEAELSRRIATQHAQSSQSGSTSASMKHRARAQALSEFLAWVRFQRKISGPERQPTT